MSLTQFERSLLGLNCQNLNQNLLVCFASLELLDEWPSCNGLDGKGYRTQVKSV